MDRIIRPFGIFGSTYKTDKLGMLLNYATYIPALAFLIVVSMGKNPATTKEGLALTFTVMLLFIAPLLTLTIRRSERVR